MVKMLQSAQLIDKSLKWTGGEAVLVQTGDILDRGENGTTSFELLLNLKNQAEKVGGEVILLLGNHELMNLKGDFRFVNDVEFTPEYRSLFHPNGKYGQILLSQATAIIIDRVLYVHAGLAPHLASMGLGTINQDVISNLKGDETQECKFHHHAYNCIIGGQGPFWTRLFAGDDNEKLCSVVSKSLKILNVDRMVIGHTAAKHIEFKCRVQLIKIDIGLQYAKTLSLLKIKDGNVSEIKIEESGHVWEDHMTSTDDSRDEL